MTSRASRPAGPTRELALATTAFLLCFAAWGMLSPIAAKLQDQLGLSETETAIMIAIPVVLGSLLRIPLGRLTDRRGGHRLFAAMLLYCAIPPLLVGSADSYPLLLLAGFLLGVAGASFAIGVPFVSRWFPASRQGWALGIYGVGTAGTALSAFTMPRLMEGPGRATAGVIYAIVLASFALVWLALARDAPAPRHAPPPLRQVWRAGPAMWLLALFYFVTFGGFVAMSIYLPKLLHGWFGLSLTDAGLRAGGFVLVAAVFARPLGGWLADRVGGYLVLVVAFLGVGCDAIGLAWQASDPAIVPVTIFCLSMAVFLGLGNGAVFKLVPHLFPRMTGAITGIVGAAGGLGGFFPPLVLGVVKDQTGTYVLAFVFLVAFAWMCAGLSAMLAGGERLAAAAGGAPAPARAAAPPAPPRRRPRVLVAGGGIAALEAVLALEEIAGARLDVALLTQQARFSYHPLAVAEPFGLARAYRLELPDLLCGRGVETIVDALTSVDAERREVVTAAGRTLRYDALLVAVGARRQGVVPGAVTFSGPQGPAEVRELLRAAAAGRIERLAFAVPAGVGWTLPAYELALMAGAHLADRDLPVDVALVTPEPRPIDAFGAEASAAIAELLELRRVAFHTAAPLRAEPGRLVVADGEAIPADAVVALPAPAAPELPGLPVDERGFVPVDAHGRVPGIAGVYAAGDVTSFPLKQGGIAAGQADAAAAAIAADLGLAVRAEPFRPVMRGLLLAGPTPRYLQMEVVRGRTTRRAFDEETVPWSPAKVAGRRLGPFLALQGIPPGAPPDVLAVELAASAAERPAPASA
jgi:NNP family nitrate/nitrite transporter-like MFS transporter